MIFPPANMLPPPVQQGTPGQRQPSGVTNPPHAPAGRTGITDVDVVIDALVSDSAASLLRAFATVQGTHQDCVPRGGPGCSHENRRALPEEWTERLVTGRQGLYAVTTNQTGQVDVFIAVDGGDYAFESWHFTLSGNRITALRIVPPIPASILNPAVLAQRIDWWHVQDYAPTVSSNLELFFVLPPRDLLQPPTGHPLTTRTGDPGIDALINIVASKDASRLTAALDSLDGTLLRKCGNSQDVEASPAIDTWARTTLPLLLNLEAVINLPDGYHPSGEHLIVFRTQFNPYHWGAFGLVERDGRITAVFDSGEWCGPEVMYPPAAYLVPPPSGGTSGLDPARRSGIRLVDAVLGAGYAGNPAVMDTLISYGTPCGHEYAPACPLGAPVGTLVEGLNSSACHGGYETRDEAPQAVIDLIQRSALYGIAEPVSPDSVLHVILMPLDSPAGAITLTFDGKGVSGIRRDCGMRGPDWLLGNGSPNFHLAPR